MEGQWGENSEPRRHTELFSSYGLCCAQEPWNPSSSAVTPDPTWGLLVALRGSQRENRSSKLALKSLTSCPHHLRAHAPVTPGGRASPQMNISLLSPHHCLPCHLLSLPVSYGSPPKSKKVSKLCVTPRPPSTAFKHLCHWGPCPPLALFLHCQGVEAHMVPDTEKEPSIVWI